MKKWEISPRLNSIIANIWGADQVKNWKIKENVWKILLGDGSQKWEVSGQNGMVRIFVFCIVQLQQILLKLVENMCLQAQIGI